MNLVQQKHEEDILTVAVSELHPYGRALFLVLGPLFKHVLDIFIEAFAVGEVSSSGNTATGGHGMGGLAHPGRLRTRAAFKVRSHRDDFLAARRRFLQGKSITYG